MGGRQLGVRGDRLRGRRAGREDRRGPRRTCRSCATIVVIDPEGVPDDAGRHHARRAARARPRPRRRRADGAHGGRRPRRPLHLHLHVGHDRAAEGLRPLARQLPRGPRHGPGARPAPGRRRRRLPLPAARPRVRAAHPARRVRRRHDDRLLRRRHEADHPRAVARSSPTYLPSVPRIFEKIYTLVTGHTATPSCIAQGDAGRPEGARARGRGPGRSRPSCRSSFDQADEQLFKNVRAAFGGRLREAVTGAAPIAKEILEFFYACGVPVMEGYGMTETATVATTSTPEDAQVRHGRQARCPACEIRIADDGEILIKGANIFQRLLQERRRVVRRGRGRLAAHRRPRLARRGRLPVDHRPQEGHHHHRGRQEPHAGQPRERPASSRRWVSQAVMHGDRRPVSRSCSSRSTRRRSCPWAKEQGTADGHRRAGRASRRCTSSIQAELDKANAQVRAGRAGQEVRDPRPRPLPGDGRADADAEGQAQRRQREVRRPASSSSTAARAGGDAHLSWLGACTDPTDTGGLFVRPPAGHGAGALPRRCPTRARPAPARRRPAGARACSA